MSSEYFGTDCCVNSVAVELLCSYIFNQTV